MSKLPKYTLWTREEDDTLRANYLKLNDTQMTLLVNRSSKGINHRRHMLGLSRASVRGGWTIADTEYLREHMAHQVDSEIAFILGRTPHSVKEKRLSLGEYCDRRQIKFNVMRHSEGPRIRTAEEVDEQQGISALMKRKFEIIACMMRLANSKQKGHNCIVSDYAWERLKKEHRDVRNRIEKHSCAF